MLNIFIAVGGSGAKVAETLVRLLAIGFPTKLNGLGLPTSAGDKLQIWRLDPDRSAGAAQALQKVVDEYDELQQHLSKENAASAWAMELDKFRVPSGEDQTIRHLDPLNLSGNDVSTNQVKTLGGILNSQERGKTDTASLLDLFYEPKDLAVEIDRGFYQKPFIGAPVMAVFAELLKDANSPGGRQCQFTFLETQPVRFFLCGSLHGGTGACGVPVMGQFLGEWKRAKQKHDWQLGGCLLAPYCIPPAPPFEKLADASLYSDELAREKAKQFSGVAPFTSLTTPEEKKQLAEQILLGFYADRDDLTERARQSLVYYKDHLTSYFNALYLVGKPYPDELQNWSNGGASQQNPLNSTEVVAALAALNFFSGAHDRDNHPNTYVIGSATRALGERMSLCDLPRYGLPAKNRPLGIDPEKVFLAAALLRHLVTHQLPWDISAKLWPNDFEALKQYYFAHPGAEDDDEIAYKRALELLANSISALLAPDHALGWDGRDYAELGLMLSDDADSLTSATGRLKKRLWGAEAQGDFPLGQSALKLTIKEFGQWAPVGTAYSRGEYLRFIWANLMAKAMAASRAV